MKQFIIFQQLSEYNPITIPGCPFNLILKFPKLKYRILLFFLSLAIAVSAENNKSRQHWQFIVSGGIHSYYAPVENLKWGQADFVASMGVNKLLGRKQQFAIGIHGQFSEYEFQGDAMGLQVLGQFTPTIFRRIELGLGAGAGYRLSFYGSKPLKWNGNAWTDGSPYKGIFQVPIQVSAGYRSVKIGSGEIRPFVAYQLQALLGYSPDLSPLPDSNLMFGLKFHFNKYN